jgi:hypothetical protein
LPNGKDRAVVSPEALLRSPWRGRLAGWLNVRLPIPIAAFRAQDRLSQLSAKSGRYGPLSEARELGVTFNPELLKGRAEEGRPQRPRRARIAAAIQFSFVGALGGGSHR